MNRRTNNAPAVGQGEGSRLQYEAYRRRRRDPVEQASRAKSQRQRSLPQLFLELARILGRDWMMVVGGVVLGTASTLLKLAPAASTSGDAASAASTSGDSGAFAADFSGGFAADFSSSSSESQFGGFADFDTGGAAASPAASD